MENTEIWKPIHQTNGRYEVSDLANIRRADNHRPIKTQRHRQGYRLVQLHIDGRRFQTSLHSVVAEAFLGPRPLGMVVCHRNDDRTNNRPYALRYDTQLANIQEAAALGKMGYGEDHPCATLKGDDVRAIRERSGERSIVLAADFGVSVSTINHIKAGRSWKHIN